jgi:hypothetical protein
MRTSCSGATVGHRVHGRGYAERHPADSQHHGDGRITSGSRFGADSQRTIFEAWSAVLAQDNDETAEDLEAGATEARHPELLGE